MDAAHRIIVPLDVSSPDEACDIVHRLRGRVGMFKVGSQLFTAAGPGIVRRIVDTGERVFLDLKLHDIPQTVARAAAEAAALGVSLMDLHIAGGSRMIRAAVEAIGTTAVPGTIRPRLLGVTVLTSLEDADLAAIGMSGPLKERVVQLALLGAQAGLDGVVASPHEISSIKTACGPDFLVVSPGIRPAGAGHQDQKRVLTPAGAITAGADYLVIGRPITRSSDPVAAVEMIAGEIAT